LPGSAFRGAVRSRGEQILRTLGGDPGACHLNTPAACHERIEQELAERKQPFPFSEELAKHCPACRIFGSGRLASALKVSDFLAIEPPAGDPLHHEFVAIDRFTGGAAGGAKFDGLASPPVRLRGEIHVDLGRLAPWGLGLLALVLRDLLHGDIPLGFATARGLNEYEARLVGIERFWLALPGCLSGQEALGTQVGEACWEPPGGEEDSPATLGALAGDDLRQALGGWVSALHGHLQQLSAPENP
jgi:CRISPR/Cas system CSM-associated protein Csm3 (group 7 of RAMP superfamily)